MNKSVITVSMLWVGMLMILSRKWLGGIRTWIQRLSGSS